MTRPGKEAPHRARQALRRIPSGRRASPSKEEKVILVLVDAVGFEAARQSFGTIESLVEFELARRWCMRSVLPSLSAPVYETLHTGTPPHIHGIRSNDRVTLSKGPHVFGLLRQAGRPTGAVAHYFFSELYNKTPYEPLRDMEVDDPALDIRHGRFYSEQGYSKANLNLPSNLDLFTRATLMIRRHHPDYLLIHSFAPDSVGHIYGADSKEYRDEVWSIDNAMAEVIHLWREEGYRILVTADHGQTADGRHGGTTDAERLVPFYDIGNPEGGVAEGIVDQLSVAPTILSILGLRPPPEMRPRLSRGSSGQTGVRRPQPTSSAALAAMAGRIALALRGRPALGEDGEDQGASAGQLDIGGVMTPVAGVGIARPAGVAGLGPHPSPGGQAGGEIAAESGTADWRRIQDPPAGEPAFRPSTGCASGVTMRPAKISWNSRAAALVESRLWLLPPMPTKIFSRP